MSTRAYPLPRPESDDPRFSFGLFFDIGKVLQEHGFPKPSGVDHVDLMMALHRFVYASEERPVPAEDTSPLRFGEYRDALAYQERRAAEAQAAGDQAALAYRTRSVETLRRRVQRDEATAQRAELHLDLPDAALAALASHAGSGVAR